VYNKIFVDSNPANYHFYIKFRESLKMFRVASPSMAINDDRAPVSYQMDSTISVTSRTSIDQIVESITGFVDQSNFQRLDNLILCAHGSPGRYQLGRGLDIISMAPFERIRGKVVRIWFRGCLIARIFDENTEHQGDAEALRHFGINSGNGHVFLSQFARLTGCFLIASTEMQGSSSSAYPSGVMDSYEGLVLRYNPQGNIVWRRRYPSLYGFDPDAGSFRSPNNE
jgi:hypothetical protein